MISNLRDACTLTETVRARSFRWRWIGGSALIVCGIAWGAGGQLVRRIERRDIDQSSRRQEPPPGFPTPLQVAINNNRVMAMGLFADLDGLAIAYMAEADSLVGPDGRFRDDLAITQIAAILKLDVDTLSKPDGVLFRAQSGRLTDTAKHVSRQLRKQQADKREEPQAVYAVWNTKDYAFTIYRLIHPTEDEKTVLDAISKAARAMMPQPGDGVRAVGVGRGEFERGGAVVAAGMLPLEATPRP